MMSTAPEQDIVVQNKISKKILKWLSAIIAVIITTIYASTWIPLPQDAISSYRQKSGIITIKDRNGFFLREVPVASGLKGKWVKLDEISPNLVAATIAAEDKRFYSHPGFDLLAITRAAFDNIDSGRIVSGGSTITQQVVRNLFGLKRSYKNKMIEIWYAARLEHMLSKREILELYLNTAPYSNQVIGAEAASRLYLGKPCAYLSHSEAAFIAAIPNSPSNLNPYRNKDKALARKDYILKQMKISKAISDSDYDRAIKEDIALYSDKSPFKAPHFTDWVIGKLPENIKNNGGEVITTLDLPLQAKIEELIKKRLSELTKDNVTNAAVIVMDNKTGDILSMVGSADYFDSGGGQVNGALSLRQPGSSIKPFTYGIAFETGEYTPSTLLPDIETHIGDYTPKNYDNMHHGPVLLRTALASSYNIPAVLVANDIGVGNLLKKLHQLGFESLKYNAAHYGPGLTLGNGEVTLLEMVRGYETIANGGSYGDERIFLKQSVSESKNVFSPEVAYLLTDILSDPVARSPAFGRNGPLELPFPVAAKTGTTSDFRDNWTLGFSADYTVGVWVGNFDGSPMEGVSGITGAAPLFKDIFMELYKDKEYPKSFPVPKSIVTIDVCSVSGDKPGPYCKTTKKEVFLSGNEPKESCTIHKVFFVDKRNSMLAGSDTPADDIEEKIYEVYPPVFSMWAASQDIIAPPTQVSDKANNEKMSIIFPKNGDVFRIDPAVPAQAQAIPLKAVVPAGINQITWKIDGKVISKSVTPYIFELPLQTGKHRIEVEGESGGRLIPSDIVYIEVISD